MTHVSAITQYEVEKEFYDFIQRSENRGFNAALWKDLNHKDDSHVSRMHNPNVPETPSWLWKAARMLDKVCRINLAVGRCALRILTRVVSRHEEDVSMPREAEMAWEDFKAVYARREDGHVSEQEFEAAKYRLFAAVADLKVNQRGDRVLV